MCLLDHHVLEGCPAEQREEQIVESEEAEVPARAVDDRRADAADDQRDRERQEKERQKQLPRARDDGRRTDERPDGADAEIGERNAGDRRSAQAVE